MNNNERLPNISTVEVLSVYQFKTLLSEFNTNAQSSALFTSTNWLETWFDYFWQKNWQLQSCAFYQNNTLIGLAPFYLKVARSFPFVKTLHLIGQGEPEAIEVASEYLDILILPGHEQALYPLITRFLNTKTYDIFNARAILASAHLTKILPQLNGNISQREYCRYMLNCQEWSINSVSKNTRSRIKRTKNQLTPHNYNIRWLANTEIANIWPTLVKFHQTRWVNKGGTGAFNSETFNCFHLSFVKHYANNVKVCALFIDEKPVAINYYLLDNSTLYFYQSGWDQENYAKLSPGLYLHYWAIEHCPVQQYDFMMGGINDSYKAKFTDTTQPMLSFTLTKSKRKIFIQKVINKLCLSLGLSK